MVAFQKVFRAFLSISLVVSLSFPSVALAASGDSAVEAASVPELVGAAQSGETGADEASSGNANSDEPSPLAFVYVGAKTVAATETQNIAFGLKDQSQTVEDAAVVLRHKTTGESVTLKPTQTKDWAFAVAFDGNSLAPGNWEVAAVAYAVAGENHHCAVNDGFGATFEVLSSEALENPIDTTFYAVENDEVIPVDSLEEAAAVVAGENLETEETSNDSGQAPAATMLSAASLAPSALETLATNVVIGLDPGHGGTDGGASASNGTREADLNWKIASYCKEELLQYYGIKNVVMSRSQNEYTNFAGDSMGLQTRVDRLKKAGANIIVSIHLNSAGSDANGAEVYAPNSWGNATVHKQGTTLATKIAAELGKLGIALRPVGSGVKYRNSDYGPSDYYSIIANAKAVGIPAVIVEHCFISNPTEFKNYLSSDAKLKALGVADAKGIASFYNLSKWHWEPTITISNPSNGKVKITVSGAGAPSNLKKVQIPVWGSKSGQNDIKWYDATKNSAGNWTVTVKLSDHKETGVYNAHVYAKRGSSDAVFIDGRSFNVPVVEASLAAPVVNTKTGKLTYTATVNAPATAKTVNLQVWCASNGKDDLKTYAMKRISGNAKSGVYRTTVSMASHKYQVGTYNAWLYVTDSNNLSSAVQKRAQKMALPALECEILPVNSGKSYKINAWGGRLNGAHSVSIAVWSSKGGQDDIRWYKAKKVSGTWQITVPLKKHKSYGTYNVHCYYKSTAKSKEKAAITKTFKVAAPKISLGKPKVNKDKGTVTYTAHAADPLGLKTVKLAVWCSKGGQDDLRWYSMKKVAGNSKEADYRLTVSMAKHKYQVGSYKAHLYVTDSVGIQAPVKAKSTKMVLPPMNITATMKSGGKYVTLIASGGLASMAKAVQFPTWSKTNGQNDIKWYKAKKVGKTWKATVSAKNHKNAGAFISHCYATVGKYQNYAGAVNFNIPGATTTMNTPTVNAAKGAVTFSAHVVAPFGVKSAKLKAWCTSIGGTDDQKTYTMKRTAGNAYEGDYTVTVSMANHKYQPGIYKGSVYIVDGLGLQATVKSKTKNVDFPTATITATPTNGGKSYLIKGSGGFLSKATEVYFPTWSEIGDQDDIVWYKAKKTNGVWQATVPLITHKTAGTYLVHCYATVSKNQGFSGNTAFSVTQDLINSLGYPIMGTTSVSQARMVARFKNLGATYPSVYKNKGAATIESFVKILCEEAAAEGVRGEVVFVQAMKETGWLKFGGDVKVDQCNFAGIGATNTNPKPATFSSVRLGLRAQIQHLKAYASTASLKNACVDPRFNLVTRGCAPNLENLNGRWAVPGDGYGESMVAMIAEL